MRQWAFNPRRFVVASLAAGGWVVVSGLLMAATFGYREMTSAFDAVGLSIPQGIVPFVTHIVVRLVLGAAVAGAFVLFVQQSSQTTAMLSAGGFVWLLADALPYVVIAQWGLFSWSVTAKLLAWDAMELLVAALVVRAVYRAQPSSQEGATR